MSQSNEGSIWRKWDLHIHTPNTKLSDNYKDENNDVWTTYCKKIEDSDVDVFGITDYFSSENYFQFIEKHKSLYPNSTKVFFPNIEFRLDVSVNKSAEEVNIHVIFSNEIPELRRKIEEILTKLHTNKTINDARITCSNLDPSDFISASVNMNELHFTLKQVFGNDKPYIIVAASNNQGLRADTRSPRKLEITDEIDKKCDAFFGGKQNVEYYLREDRYETSEIAKQKPIFNGCDAHSFSDLESYLGKHFIDTNSNDIVSSITWIKAEPTFEGLKQVLYEPKYRVLISEQQPRNPIRKIDFIKFNFPTNTKIKRVNSNDKQDFCLKNIKKEIYFSKYLTCLIGGRGTGKSTIINTLGEHLNEKTDFFESNKLLINDKEYNISSDDNNYIEIKGTNEIEFVSQGKVERLAEANELTKLIFNERIKETDSSFNSLDNEHQELTKLIDTNIDNLFSLVEKTNSLKEQEQERDKVKNIIDSINDEDYKIITSEISRIKTQLTEIKNSKLRYSKLLDLIKNILSEIPQVNNENDIEHRISEILNLLSSLDEIEITEDDILVKVKEFSNIQETEKTLNDSFNRENSNLASFFSKKGTSEEAIKDSQNANEKLAQIISKIRELEDDKSTSLKHYSEEKDRIDNIKNLNSDYENLINKNIEYINRNLEVSNENILRINYKHKFDDEKYLDGLFDEFYSIFSKYHRSGVQESKIKEVLFTLKPSEDLLALSYKEFIEKFDNEINSNGINRNNLYVKVLLEIFENKYHFIIYQLLIKKHLYNLPKYIQIDGYYGERELIDCSFGQRCTAVIVTLLMSGVKPLVIDEPEAHLDNRLIADYLVDLIKNKKLDRQIIFATHNSNFVINGDAELIHILDIPNNDIYTNITSTSIENKRYRNKLLKLEGGEKAFLIRENKYGFTK